MASTSFWFMLSRDSIPAMYDGATLTTITPENFPAARTGRVNWIDHWRDTRPNTGALRNIRLSAPLPWTLMCSRSERSSGAVKGRVE